MRIPRAVEYFGQRSTKKFPTVDPHLGVPDRAIDSSGIKAAEELHGIGEAIGQIGLNEVAAKRIEGEKEQYIRDKRWEEEQAKLEQAQKEKEHSDLQTSVINFRGDAKSLADSITNNPDIPDDQKYSEFETKLQDYTSKLKDNTPAHLRHTIDPVNTDVTNDAKGYFSKVQQNNLLDQSRANVDNSLITLRKQAVQSDKDFNNAVSIVNSDSFSWYGYTAKDAVDQKAAFLSRISEDRMKVLDGQINQLDHNKGLQQIKTLRNQLNAKNDNAQYAFLPDLDPEVRQSHIISLNHKEGEVTDKIQMEQRQRHTEIKQDLMLNLDFYKDALEKGTPLKNEDVISLRTGILKFKDPALLMKMNNIEQQYGPVYRMQQQIKDPLFGTGFEGITLQTMVQSIEHPEILNKSVDIAKEISKKQLLNFTALFKQDAADAIGKNLNTQPDNMIMQISAIQQAVGPTGPASIRYLASQVSKNDEIAGTAIAYLSDGNVSVAKKLLMGNRILKDSKDIGMPSEKDLRNEFNTYTKDISLSNLTSLSKTYEAWKAYYAYHAAENNIKDGTLNDTIAENTLAEIVGERTSIGGKNTIIPTWLTEDKFKNMIKSINGDMIVKQGMAGNITKGGYLLQSDDMAEVIRDSARFHEVRDGVYRLEVDGQILRSGTSGKYLEIAFTKDGPLMQLSADRNARIEAFTKEKQKYERGHDSTYDAWKDTYHLP